MSIYQTQLGFYLHTSHIVRADKTNRINVFMRPLATGLIRFVPRGRTLM